MSTTSLRSCRSDRTFALRRATVALTALLALLVVLPGCASGPPSIVLWHAYRGGEEAALDALAQRYAREQGVRVELLAIPFDAYAAKLEAAVPHAHGPDVFIEAHERLGSYLEAKLVAPIGDALPDDEVSKYDATAIEAVTLGGTRYAVPLASKCLALYVNEAFQLGPLATLEDLGTVREIAPARVYPLAYEAQDPYFHAAFLHAFGGRMLDDQEHFGFVGDAGARSLEFVRGLTERRSIPEEPSGSLVAQLFVSGNAAAVISGPWLAADVGDKVKYRVEPLPVLRETGKPLRPFLTVEGVMLTPTGSKRSDVRAFARWLGSEDSAVVRATVGRQIVATESAWKRDEVKGATLLEAFHRAAQQALPMPTSTAMRATWVPAQQAIRKVLRGDAKAKDALDEARERFDDIMRPAPPPPSPTPLLLVIGVLLIVAALFAVRRARTATFRRELRASVPAYKYVAHAAVAVFALVVLPLIAGALTSLFVGTRDAPRYVGLGNYLDILTARGGPLLAHGSFYLTLIVTVVWTIANVALHVAIGLTLGVLLSRPLLKMKAVYRVLLILPWAVPSYVTALAWKGMFHRQFGAINAVLKAVGAEPVSWFSHFATSFAANVATNVWLGFPFMMVVTLGALTSIPKDVLEAADVDGATRWQRFRMITLPLLGPALLPAVVLGAVWTFNMFNVVFLVSGGEPDGTTDILVSEAYRWAFTRSAQYGYAAAYAVLIFFLLAAGSRLFGKLAARGQESIA